MHMNSFPSSLFSSRRLISQRTPRRRALEIAALLLFPALSLQAVERTWDGGSETTSNWNAPENWDENTLPQSGDSLFFDGGTRLTSSNNLGSGTLFNGITFRSTAGAFTFSGNPVQLGGDLVNESANLQTIGFTVRLMQADLEFETVGDILQTGIISDNNEGNNLIKTGAGKLTVTSTNSNWTGGITIKEGTVRSEGHTRNLGTASAPITLAGGNLELAHNNTTNFAYANPVYVEADGTITFDRITAGNAGTRTMGDVFMDGHELTIVKGANITNAATHAFGTLNLAGDSTLNIATDTNASFIGVRDGDGGHGLTKEGSGTLVLTGASAHAGAITVAGGTLQLGNASSGVGDIINESRVEINRTTASGASVLLYEGIISGDGSLTRTGVGRVALTGDHTYTGGTTIEGGVLELGNMGATGSVTGNIVNNGTLRINRTNTYTYDGVISGAGAVQVYNGHLVLTGSNVNTGDYGVASAGRLELDFSAAGAPVQNIVNSVSNSSAMSLAGGEVILTGAAGEDNAQRFNGLTSTSGGGRLSATAGTGGTLNVSLGALSITNSGAVAIVKNSATTLTTTTAADVGSGIYSGRYVINDGTGWNWVTSTDIGGGNYRLEAMTSYVDLPATDEGTDQTEGNPEGSNHTYLAGNGDLRGAVKFNTLKIDTIGEDGVLDLGGNQVTIGTAVGAPASSPGGILFVGADDYEITNGSLNRNSGIPRTIIIQQYGEGVLTISARIHNGSPVGASTSFVKAGTGELVLTGANSYDGSTHHQEGILTIVDAANLGSVSRDLFIYTGATLRADATFSLSNTAGTTHKAVILNGHDARIDVTGEHVLTLNGTVSGGYGSLNKTGTGTLVLNGSNTYGGETQVSMGTLIVNSSLASASGVHLDADGALGGSGSVGRITGSGRINPGNSPGILSAASVDHAEGLDYAFEFTLAGNPLWNDSAASGNDVLRLTDPNVPILGAATVNNVFDLYFSDYNTTYVGGLFTDLDSNFEPLVADATYHYYILDEGGSILYNGNTYRALDASLVLRSTVQIASADFLGGTINDGWAQQFAVVPEPGTWLLIGAGAGMLLLARRRRIA